MKGTIHVAGVGGVGMSALAQALLDQGAAVSGSDRLFDAGEWTPALRCLQGQGVRLFPQDGTGVDARTARLVVSSAIEADNPERVRAGGKGIPVSHRAEELARVTAGRRLVAVTGTCGKSTVTAMLGCLLEGAGFDPLVVNGAAVAGWDAGGARIGAVRAGRGEWAVIEADESDKSLMVFRPEHAVITNVSADHFGVEETRELFAAFRARVPGVVIDGRDGADSGPAGARAEGWDGFFCFEGTEYQVPMPGEHNIRNAWHAVRLARALGADPARLAAALRRFGGVERRLQRVGRCGAAAVVDDYAHNPEKLAAAWTTLAAAFPAGVCALWRPHGFAPLRKMMTDLAAAFARVCRPQDTLLLPPVYDAGGTADRTVGSDVLASLLRKKGVTVLPVQTLGEAEARMREKAVPGGVLVTFGARDPGLPRLAARLAGQGEAGKGGCA
ncbi:MAG: Mur ligase domain-containing protein [Kiritimatiellia bacterium]|jgi:UDP-N-acetylmuramate--alanine ligase|nr:Mur ligase domain-containing protein [Kiritimatiellia bacterium]